MFHLLLLPGDILFIAGIFMALRVFDAEERHGRRMVKRAILCCTSGIAYLAIAILVFGIGVVQQ